MYWKMCSNTKRNELLRMKWLITLFLVIIKAKLKTWNVLWGQDLPRLEQKRDIKSPVVIRSTLVSRAFRINLKQRPISFLLILLTAHISCYNTTISNKDSGTVPNNGTFYNLWHNSQKPAAQSTTNYGTRP